MQIRRGTIVGSSTPAPVDGTAAAVGAASVASREDHVHALGPLVANLDVNSNLLLNILAARFVNAGVVAGQGVERVSNVWYLQGDALMDEGPGKIVFSAANPAAIMALA